MCESLQIHIANYAYDTNLRMSPCIPCHSVQPHTGEHRNTYTQLSNSTTDTYHIFLRIIRVELDGIFVVLFLEVIRGDSESSSE
jgi:hypothetical protein